ncbi:MAG TPA: hypothetical protein VE913_04605 [Longimicrobium sp.]|nr:hypothetical protein [Longimicrobium sp.]
MFDEGLWVLREVALRYHGPGAVLSVFYRGDQDALYLGFTMTDGRSTELMMRADRHLGEILDIIIAHQDRLNSATFREPIRAFMDAGVEVFASKDGDTFLRLTDKKQGSSLPTSN